MLDILYIQIIDVTKKTFLFNHDNKIYLPFKDNMVFDSIEVV